MLKNRKIIIPTEEEDLALTAAALGDPDAQPMTDQQLAQFSPLRGRGRPKSDNTKVATNVRYDRDLLDAFKATGDGWQTRMNKALRDWAELRGLLPKS